MVLLQHNKNMKAIPGYDGYFATEEGEIYSSKYRVLRKLKPKTASSGHQSITNYQGGIKRYLLVHRLILLTFVGECPEGMEACHNDGDPTNNRLENLRWGSISSNAIDRVKHGSQHTAKLTESDVKDIRWMLSLKLKQKDIALMFGVHPSQISQINSRKSWSYVQ